MVSEQASFLRSVLLLPPFHILLLHYLSTPFQKTINFHNQETNSALLLRARRIEKSPTPTTSMHIVGDRSNPRSLILAKICSHRCLFDFEVLSSDSISKPKKHTAKEIAAKVDHQSRRQKGRPGRPYRRRERRTCQVRVSPLQDDCSRCQIDADSSRCETPQRSPDSCNLDLRSSLIPKFLGFFPSQSRRFFRRAGIRGEARFLRGANSRRMMMEQSVMVREVAAEQIDKRQSDWAYSTPTVVLDLVWNTFFVGVTIVVLFLSLDERSMVPLRMWFVGYGVQCVLHMVCVCLEYKRRREMSLGFSNPGSGSNLNSNSRSNSNSSVSVNDDILGASMKLFHSGDSLAFPSTDMLVTLSNRNKGEDRPKVTSYLVQRLKLCYPDLSRDAGAVSSISHILALLLSEDTGAREVAAQGSIVSVAIVRITFISNWLL